MGKKQQEYLTPEEAKEWLSTGRGVSQEIEALKKAKEASEMRAGGVSAGVKRSTNVKSKGRDRGDGNLVEMAALSAQIDARIKDLERMLADIGTAIATVKDGMERVVLLKRYVLFQKWEKIAVDMDFYYQHVHRLHKKALSNIRIKKM